MPRPRLAHALTAVVLLHLAAALWFAGHRPIDGDEGYYGLAARLVSEGQHPYADFFYPQAPLLPYVYAPAARLVGAPQLPDLRYLSVAFGVAAVALLALWAGRAHGKRPWLAVSTVWLVASDPELITWLVTVKTYALTGLAVALAVLASQRAGGGGRRAWWWAGVGGLAMGLGASTRALLAPAAVAPALWWLLAPRDRRPGPAAAWLLGAALGAAPLVITFLHDADRFWFNNVGYHQLRFSALEHAPLVVRAAAALETLLLAVLANPGLLLLTALAAWGLRPRRPGAAAADPAVAPSLVMAATYTVSCLLPDPVHMQYVTGVLPLLLVPAAAQGLSQLPWPDHRTALAAGAAMSLAAVLSLGLIRHDLPAEPHWQLDHYRRVCRVLARGTGPDDVVFAFWSGYPAGCGRRPLPGMENQFAVGVSERLDRVQRRRYRVPGREELARAFRGREAAVAVIGAWMYDINTALDDPQMELLLAQFQQNYELIEEIDGVKLCRPLPAAR